jgi:hypothetical protein
MRSAMLQTCFRFKKAGAPLRIKLRTLIQLKLLLRRQRTVVEGSALVPGITNRYCSPSFETARSLSSGAHSRDPLVASSG